MIRILLFLLLVFALGLGFAWLADRPGTMLVTVAGREFETSLLVAAVAVVAIVAAVLVTWWVLKSIWNSPRAVSRYFRARKRDRGYQSLSTGMIAAGAGDAEAARRMNKQALQNLNADQEPLLHLLEAQTLLLESDHDGARRKFEAMTADPETRLLGLRGLFLEAQRLREPEAARHYAEEAAKQAPQLGWASNAALEARSRAGDWEGALQLLEQQASTKQIPKEMAARRRAVLLTARAIDKLDADPTAARNAALQAVKLAPELVPASVTAARAMVRLNDLRKASKTLETIWRKEPHPEVADTYVHLRAGDSAADRLKRARKLQSLKTHHRESAMAVARAAYEAGDYTQARQSLEAVLKQDPREGAYLLLADIEESETGDIGRVRHWLAQAVRAPRDPAWTADGQVSERWAAFSPATGRLDAFEWKVPVERLGPSIDAEAGAEPEPASIPIMPPPPEAELTATVEPLPAEAAAPEPVAEAETGPPATAVEPPAAADAEEAVPPETAAQADGPAKPDGAADEPVEAAEAAPTIEEPVAGPPPDDKPAAEPPSVEVEPPATAPAEAAPAPQQAASETGETAESVKGNGAAGSQGDGEAVEAKEEEAAEPEEIAPPSGDPADSRAETVVPPRPPDDPGVDPDAAVEQPRSRFRLF